MGRLRRSTRLSQKRQAQRVLKSQTAVVQKRRLKFDPILLDTFPPSDAEADDVCEWMMSVARGLSSIEPVGLETMDIDGVVLRSIRSRRALLNILLPHTAECNDDAELLSRVLWAMIVWKKAQENDGTGPTTSSQVNTELDQSMEDLAASLGDLGIVDQLAESEADAVATPEEDMEMTLD